MLLSFEDDKEIIRVTEENFKEKKKLEKQNYINRAPKDLVMPAGKPKKKVHNDFKFGDWSDEDHI